MFPFKSTTYRLNGHRLITSRTTVSISSIWTSTCCRLSTSQEAVSISFISSSTASRSTTYISTASRLTTFISLDSWLTAYWLIGFWLTASRLTMTIFYSCIRIMLTLITSHDWKLMKDLSLGFCSTFLPIDHFQINHLQLQLSVNNLANLSGPSIKAFRWIFMFTQILFPSLYNYTLQVYLHIHSITTSKCISKLTKLRSSRSSTDLLKHGLQVHIQTCLTFLSRHISNCTKELPAASTNSSCFKWLIQIYRYIDT